MRQIFHVFTTLIWFAAQSRCKLLVFGLGFCSLLFLANKLVLQFAYFGTCMVGLNNQALAFKAKLGLGELDVVADYSDLGAKELLILAY